MDTSRYAYRATHLTDVGVHFRASGGISRHVALRCDTVLHWPNPRGHIILQLQLTGVSEFGELIVPDEFDARDVIVLQRACRSLLRGDSDYAVVLGSRSQLFVGQTNGQVACAAYLETPFIDYDYPSERDASHSLDIMSSHGVGFSMHDDDLAHTLSELDVLCDFIDAVRKR